MDRQAIDRRSRRPVLIVHDGLVYVKADVRGQEAREGAEASVGSRGCGAFEKAREGLECQEESSGVNRNKAA